MAVVPAMARDRKTARMQEQIKVLLSQGLSIRKVALALGISRQTVRRERFAQEQPLLRALPQSRFELFDWRPAKVHPDCHVQVDKNFYSVPHRMIRS